MRTRLAVSLYSTLGPEDVRWRRMVGGGITWGGRGGGDSDDIDLHLQYRTTTRKTGVHKTTRHRIYIHT